MGGQLLVLDLLVLLAARLAAPFAWFVVSLWILPAFSLSFSAYETIFLGRGGMIAVFILLVLSMIPAAHRRKSHPAALRRPRYV